MTLTVTFQSDRGEGVGSTSDQIVEALAAIGFVRTRSPISEAVAEHLEREIASELSVPATDKSEHPARGHTAAEAEKPKRGRKPKEDKAAAAAADEEKPQISTGDERVGPEDTPEEQAQDAADEAAEQAAEAATETLTLDDLRTVMGGYANTYGMAAAQEDGKLIFKEALGPVPADAKNPDGSAAVNWRLTLVPETQEALGKVVAGWRAATVGNPFDRPVAGA